MDVYLIVFQIILGVLNAITAVTNLRTARSKRLEATSSVSQLTAAKPAPGEPSGLGIKQIGERALAKIEADSNAFEKREKAGSALVFFFLVSPNLVEWIVPGFDGTIFLAAACLVWMSLLVGGLLHRLAMKETAEHAVLFALSSAVAGNSTFAIAVLDKISDLKDQVRRLSLEIESLARRTQGVNNAGSDSGMSVSSDHPAR